MADTAVKITNHPCFNNQAKHTYGRVHLPVAPRCNVQCNFCSRKYDCVAESRPGVTSVILNPEQALNYLEKLYEIKGEFIQVVGIAGPGDPLANPDETLRTLQLVRQNFPGMVLCLATNGLMLPEYAHDLISLGVSHVTITINAVHPLIGEKIYAWIKYNKRTLRPHEGSQILLENQLLGLKELKKNNIIVKINSVVIPGINDDHITDIAKLAAYQKADMLNILPYYPSKECEFCNIESPDSDLLQLIKKESAKYIPLMNHCNRCRADAAGLITENINNPEITDLLKTCQSDSNSAHQNNKLKNYKRIALATREGILINQHLGEAKYMLIFERKRKEYIFLEKRELPEKGGGMKRWQDLAEILTDCQVMLVSGIGEKPKQIFREKNIKILVLNGMITQILNKIFNNESLQSFIVKSAGTCGSGCTGTGLGCA